MNAIHLLSLGNADRTLVEGLAPLLRRTFGVNVHVLDVAWNITPSYDDERAQYNSSTILSSLIDHHPSPRLPSGTILGITSEDLFIPILTYVFGEAELNGNVAVVSYHRLQSERYGLPPNPALLAARLWKETLHELGHTYGLVHCRSLECVMHTSTYAEDIDLKGGDFCADCWQELKGRNA